MTTFKPVLVNFTSAAFQLIITKLILLEIMKNKWTVYYKVIKSDEQSDAKI